RPVEAGLPVHVRGRTEVAPQRRLRPDGDRDVAPAGDLERDERVAGRLVERLVAGDGRDPDQLHLRRGEREQDRDRVVVARIAVDDDRRHHSSASTSSAVGSEVWAPNREAARAPAVHARRSDSSRDRPSSSETTRQAVNASPAAVPSTASTAGGSARATSCPSSRRTAPSAPSVPQTRPGRSPSASSPRPSPTVSPPAAAPARARPALTK